MKSLAERLADGEEGAFDAFYGECAPRLYRFLIAATRSREIAADVLQETFLRAVRFRDRLRDVESPEAWIFTVARREACRALNREQRNVVRVGNAAMEEVPGESDIQAADDRDELQSVLCELSEQEREVVELHVYGGLTFREVAQVTDTPPGTVATRYRTAIGKLKVRLGANHSVARTNVSVKESQS